MATPDAQAQDSGTARLFLALWPDTALRQALGDWRDRWQWPACAVLVPPEQLHLTLHFLGNLPAGRLPELEQGLDLRCEPFVLDFGRSQLWPHGIAVLEPAGADAAAAREDLPRPLLQLHKALRLALKGLAVPTETRAYRPHITLARHAQAAVPPAQGPALRWQVDAYALVRAWPARPGSAGGYSVVRRYG
jgi:2'-5' RNA ligase